MCQFIVIKPHQSFKHNYYSQSEHHNYPRLTKMFQYFPPSPPTATKILLVMTPTIFPKRFKPYFPMVAAAFYIHANDPSTTKGGGEIPRAPRSRLINSPTKLLYGSSAQFTNSSWETKSHITYICSTIPELCVDCASLCTGAMQHRHLMMVHRVDSSRDGSLRWAHSMRCYI